MFFDPLGTRVPADRGAAAYRTRLRHPVARAAFVLVCFAPLAVGLVARGLAVIVADSSADLVLPLAAVAGAGTCLAVTWARGVVFLAMVGALVAGAAYTSMSRNGWADMGQALARLGSTAAAADGLLRVWSALAAGVWALLGGWWVYGKRVGFGGCFRLPPRTRFDPLLGNRSRYRVTDDTVVAYVRYPRWAAFEEVTNAVYRRNGAVPVRGCRRSDASAASKLVGPIGDNRWVELCGGAVSVYALLDGLMVTMTEDANAGSLWSAFGRWSDGLRCDVWAAGTDADVVDLVETAKLRVNVSRDRSLCRQRDGHLPIEMAVPRLSTDGVTKVYVTWVEPSYRPTLSHVNVGGVRLEPIRGQWRHDGPDGTETPLVDLLSHLEKVTLVVSGVPSVSRESALNELSRLVPQRYVQHVSVTPEGTAGALDEWLPVIGRPLGRCAEQYLRWAMSPDSRLPSPLAIDGRTGRLTFYELDAKIQLTDLGGHILLESTDSQRSLLLLPLPNSLTLDFCEALHWLIEFVDIYRPRH